MLIFLQEFALQIFLWLLQLVDGIMSIFSAISGVATVNVNGEQVNLIENLMGNPTVETIFWCIFILAVGLTCIFTIAALIRNMINSQRTVVTIVGKFFLALLGTMAILAVVVLGILIANAVLQLIARIFQVHNTVELSNTLFDACVGEWLNGYSVAELDVTSLSVHDIFGDYNTAVFGIWPTSWKNNGMVNPDSFMYMPALISSIAVSIALIVAVINLAKRIYEILILYIIMPVSMSTLPLDDGARVKIWRETFISKIMTAYGAVISVNMFILLMPIINKMHLSGASGFCNAIFLIFMIIGGAMLIPASMSLFARLFGQGDDNHAGGGFLHSAFYGGRIASALTIGAATKMIAGGYKIITHGKARRQNNKGDGDDSGKYSEEKGGGDSGTEGGTSDEGVANEDNP